MIGSSGHFLVELVGQDSLAKAEATNGNISYSNEFFKMRMGMQIEGIKEIFDPNSKYRKAIDKVTPLVNPDLQTIDKYMKMLEYVRTQEELDKGETKQDDILGKLSALVETMKDRGVSETEAMMGIMAFSAKGFLGKNLEKSLVKQNVEDEIRGVDGRSAIIISNLASGEFYVVNGQNMTVEELQKKELIERFNAGKYEYRDAKHTIHALEGEVPVPEDKGKGEKNDNVR